MSTGWRMLSSRQTFFAKVLSPVIWIVGVGFVAVGLFVTSDALPGQGRPAPPEARWLVLALWLGGCAFTLSSMRFKRVRMDEQRLQISNYITEIEVPLTDLVAVSENTWLKTHPVTIELCRHTAFGNRVVFMPKVRWRARWRSPHPVVDEISSAVDRARRGAAGAT